MLPEGFNPQEFLRDIWDSGPQIQDTPYVRYLVPVKIYVSREVYIAYENSLLAMERFTTDNLSAEPYVPNLAFRNSRVYPHAVLHDLDYACSWFE